MTGTSGPADEDLLREAIDLARQARAAGDPPFGSLLVDADGVVVRRERNTTVTDNDVTAHPELKLARWAAAQGLTGTTMYTSCEPCPMCGGAIRRARIGRVVYALATEQLAGLRPGTPPPDAWQVDLDGPHLLDEAAAAVTGG